MINHQLPIKISHNIANSPELNAVDRFKTRVPNALNWILMKEWEVRSRHPHSLPELIEDLESYTLTFRRYLDNKTTNFSDQIDNQVIRDLSSYYTWKTNNSFNISNNSINNLVKINDILVSEVWIKIIQKLEIKWDWVWDASELIADEFEKRNFA